MKQTERWQILIIGTMMASLGMAIVTKTQLGNATLTVLWDGMTRHTHLTIGLASYVTSVLMMCCSLFLDRSQLKLGTVVHFVLFGAFMDVFALMPIAIDHGPFKYISMFLGITLLGVGIGIYAYADLGRGPYEGICFALSNRSGIELKYIRTFMDGTFALIGYYLGGIVGISTLANLLISGYIIQRTMYTLDRYYRHKKTLVLHKTA